MTDDEKDHILKGIQSRLQASEALLKRAVEILRSLQGGSSHVLVEWPTKRKEAPK